MAGSKAASFTMTYKTAVASLGTCSVVLFGAIWALLSFTMGNVRDDISDIRSAVTKAQDGNAETQKNAVTGDAQLNSEISSLTAELKVTNARLSDLSTSVTGLSETVRGVDQRLASSVHQQTLFERWVVLRLGPAGMQRTEYEVPEQWAKQQSEIFPSLVSGDDPFIGWYKAASDFK